MASRISDWECSICDREFKSAQGLSSHLKSKQHRINALNKNTQNQRPAPLERTPPQQKYDEVITPIIQKHSLRVLEGFSSHVNVAYSQHYTETSKCMDIQPALISAFEDLTSAYYNYVTRRTAMKMQMVAYATYKQPTPDDEREFKARHESTMQTISVEGKRLVRDHTTFHYHPPIKPRGRSLRSRRGIPLGSANEKWHYPERAFYPLLSARGCYDPQIPVLR